MSSLIIGFADFIFQKQI